MLLNINNIKWNLLVGSLNLIVASQDRMCVVDAASVHISP